MKNFDLFIKDIRILFVFLYFFSLTGSSLVHAGDVNCECDAGYSELYERIIDSVACIVTEKKVTQGAANGMDQFFSKMPKEFREFFENFDFKFFQENGNKSEDFQKFTAGSGFIISEDGYIVTNYHVIKGADRLNVELHNKSTFTANVVGYDSLTDLALLKIDLKENKGDTISLTPLKFADSDKLKIGDKVLALGHPYGLIGSVNSGIISGLSRDIGLGVGDFIQIDASLNSGHSGGPLVDMNGQVVGVNTVAILSNGSTIGISFAIPSNSVTNIVNELKVNKRIKRGGIGIEVVLVDKQLADSLGLKEAYGILVNSIDEGSSASRSKLKVGDIILEYDGKRIDSLKSMKNAISSYEIGKKIEFTVFRNKKTLKIQVEVQEIKKDRDSSDAFEPNNDSVDAFKSDLLDFSVTDIKNEKNSIIKKGGESGVLVANVEPNGNAANMGIESGDLITQVNQIDIKNLNDFKNAISSIQHEKRNHILLRVTKSAAKGSKSEHFVILPLK